MSYCKRSDMKATEVTRTVPISPRRDFSKPSKRNPRKLISLAIGPASLGSGGAADATGSENTQALASGDPKPNGLASLAAQRLVRFRIGTTLGKNQLPQPTPEEGVSKFKIENREKQGVFGDFAFSWSKSRLSYAGISLLQFATSKKRPPTFILMPKMNLAPLPGVCHLSLIHL